MSASWVDRSTLSVDKSNANNFYKYEQFLFMEFEDARSAQTFVAGHDTFGSKQKYEGVLRINVHNELRFPLSLTTKPPWFRVVPMSEGDEKVAVNHMHLVKKQMEDHFDADTATLADDRETPATFMPLARSQ